MSEKIKVVKNSTKKAKKKPVYKKKPNETIIKKVDFKELSTKEFKKEKDLQEWIIDHIEDFCRDILEDELVSYEAEKPILKQYVRSPRGRTMDIFIVGKINKYIIELKNPFYAAENRYAIGQILDYGRELPDCKMFLITTKYDIHTARTIKYYKLPIRYIYISKDRMCEYYRDLEGDEDGCTKEE